MSAVQTEFTNFFHRTPVVIGDGATGTEFQRRGFELAEPLWSARWNTEAPKTVWQIHADNLNAGANFGTANIFRSTRRTYKKAGRSKEEADDSFNAGVDILLDVVQTVRAAGREVFAAASVAPLEDCYDPSVVPSRQELADEHGFQVERLARKGIDIILFETVNSPIEAQEMARAAQATSKPYILSFRVDDAGNLPGGVPVVEAVRASDFTNRLAVSINCSPIEHARLAFDKLRASYAGPIGVYPNYNCKTDEHGKQEHTDAARWPFDLSGGSKKFVLAALDWVNEGAKFVAGCCGTTPDDISNLSAAVTKLVASPKFRASGAELGNRGTQIIHPVRNGFFPGFRPAYSV